MEGGIPNGSARVDRVERNLDRLADRVAASERTLAALPFFQEEMREIAADVKATREWVEERERQRIESEQQKEQLTTAQKGAIIAGSAVVVSSIIGAVASLAGSGAF